MNKIRILELKKSFYCWVIFGVMLLISYFMVPMTVWHSYYSIIGISFIFIFSLTITCLVRDIKERAKEIKNYGARSALNLLFGIIGLSAIQTCAIGSSVCGASIGIAIISSLFPTIAINFLITYSVPIITISMILQIISLWQMRCFDKINTSAKKI